LLLLYGIKLWRRIAPAFAPARALPRVGYRRVLDQLAEAGLARRFGETREQFAARVGDISPSFIRLTELHVAASLRDPALPRGSRPELSTDEWRATMGAVLREIPRGTRTWRRLLGLFHPTSFLDSR
jgi:protein-glutamine gamma-glutamyltransferase